MGLKDESPLDFYLIPHGTLSGGLRYTIYDYLNSRLKKNKFFKRAFVY
jgi:hypothetical protein